RHLNKTPYLSLSRWICLRGPKMRRPRYAFRMKAGIHIGAPGSRVTAPSAMLTIFLTAFCAIATHAQSASTIPGDMLVQPDVLHHQLEASPDTVLILQVGSHLLYNEDHI